MARQTAERMATVKENLSIKDGRKNGRGRTLSNSCSNRHKFATTGRSNYLMAINILTISRRI